MSVIISYRLASLAPALIALCTLLSALVPSGLAQTPVNVTQPSVALNYIISTTGILPSAGSSPEQQYLGEVRAYAGSTAPTGWALADGSTLSVAGNSALFSLLETTYGGNGTTTFALPDLRGRTVIDTGTGAGLTARTLGTTTGAQAITLTGANLPSGGDQAFSLMQPSLALNYGIFTTGLFALHGDGTGLDGPTSTGFIAQMTLFAGISSSLPGTAPSGQVLTTGSNAALFSILGTTYGGNGTTNFDLPDLRGRTIIGAGLQPGLTNRALGSAPGAESFALQANNLPTSGDAPFSLMQPSLAFTYLIDVEGDGGSADIGSISAFAGNFTPAGWMQAAGQSLSTSTYSALFGVVGYSYGGSGGLFNLPDLRGVTIIGAGAGPGLTPWALGQTTGAETATLTMGQIPEPSTLATLALGATALVGRRRRKHRAQP